MEENGEVRISNDELKAEEVPEGSRESLESLEGQASQASQASHQAVAERAAFVARAAREWVAELVGTALPGRLLDDLWLEGEMAVCFGESGAGKSVLAVQAADAIASGVPLTIEEGRFEVEVDGVKRCGKKAPAEPRTVLYFDLALTRTQFGRRYISEPDPEDTEFSDYKYEFPDNFVRLQLDLAAETPDQYKTKAEYLLAEIEAEVRKRNAKVVIIDSLDRMTEYGILRSREAAYIMSRLNLLRHELGLSVLVLAQLSRRSDSSPLSATRLLTTRTISAFADSVFAIGMCRGDERLRYLKHLGSRSTGIIYDSSYLPVLCLWPCETNFLSFQLNGFVDEAEVLDAYSDQQRHDRSDQVKEMAAEGWKQREIAVRLSMSLGSVNRALNIWSPFDDRPKPLPPSPTPTPKPARPTKRVETVEQASKKKKVPTPRPESESPDDALPSGSSRNDSPDTPDSVDLPTDISLGIHSPHVVAARTRGWSEYDHDPTVELDSQDIVCNLGHPMFGLKRRLDSINREIFVAREHAHNLKPEIWYTYANIPGRFTRSENPHNSRGTSSHTTEITHSYQPPPPREE